MQYISVTPAQLKLFALCDTFGRPGSAGTNQIRVPRKLTSNITKIPGMRADFSQSLDVCRPHTLLTENPKRSADLVYRYDDTGETALVPNIWYNQTFQLRVDAIRWDAMQAEAQAIKYESSPPCWVSAEAAVDIARRYRERAARIRSEATRVEIAGNPEYPTRAARLDVNYGDNV